MSKHKSFAGRLRVQTTVPTTPKDGEEYFNNSTGMRRRHDGTDWRGSAYTTTSTSTTTTTSISTSTTTS